MRQHANPKVVHQWHEEHCDRCWVCAAYEGMRGVIKIALHHILNGGRYGRPDFAWNFASLCERWDGQGCHTRLDKGRPERAICLRLKAECDPENVDNEAMLAWMQRGGSTETLPTIPGDWPDWIRNLREQYETNY